MAQIPNKVNERETYFESDSGSRLADYVDDILAARVLYVTSVHFQQSVARQQSCVQLFAAWLGEDHRPPHRTPKKTKKGYALHNMSKESHIVFPQFAAVLGRRKGRAPYHV